MQAYCSENIVRVIKSRLYGQGMWPVRETGEVHTGFWWGDITEREHLEDPGVYGRITLQLIYRKWDGCMEWIDLVQNRDRWRGFFECGNEPSGSIKLGEFLDKLRNGN